MEKEIINFIKNKYKSKKNIYLHEPVFNGNEKKYLEECIDSTYVSSVGPFVDRFEILMNKITQTGKTTAVVNGTAGLQVGLRLIGVKKNDEVITQALTFVATANAIAYNNAHPIFLDVDYDTMGLSPIAVSDFLEEFGELRDEGCYNKKSGRRISACMPMHTFGFPVHLEELIKEKFVNINNDMGDPEWYYLIRSDGTRTSIEYNECHAIIGLFDTIFHL